MMESRVVCAVAFVAATLACVSSRAVNISNTWMLPEEGFPVFYRYFRDRISWYEADAVCQFHHANLVTVDNTSQFDTVRAFLKELDIANNVWIGLSRNSEKAQFVWSDFQPLTNEGYWQEAVPETTGPVCAATDPAADFRWHGLPCGGPDVASFICELPVPQWATGTNGCLITELPSLTVLYVPEQSAVELISDCGLDGTKQIVCKGNADREEMMKQLSCGVFDSGLDDKSTRPSVQMNSSPDLPVSYANTPISTETKTTKHWTSNTVDVDDYYPTRHRRETDNTLNPVVTRSTLKIQNDLKLEYTTVSNILRGDTLEQEFFSTERNPSSINKTEKDVLLSTDTTTVDAKTPSPSTQEDGNEYSGVINQGQLFSILDNASMFDIVELNETGSEENGSVKELLLTTQHAQKLTTNRNKEEPSVFTTPRTTPSEVTFTTVLYQKEPPADEMPVTNKDIKKHKKETETQTFPTNRTYEENARNSETDASFTEQKNSLDKKVELAIYQASEGSRSLRKQGTMNDLTANENDKTLSREMEFYPIATDPNAKLNRTFRKQLPNPEEKYPQKFSKEHTTYFSANPTLSTTNTPSSEEINEHIILEGNKTHKVVEIKLDSPKNENITKLVITTKLLRGKKNEVTPNSLVAHDKITSTTESSSYKEPIKNTVSEKNNDTPSGLKLNTSIGNTEHNISRSLETHFDNLKKDEIEQETGKELLTTADEDRLEDNESTLQSLQSEPEIRKKVIRNRKLSKPQHKSFYPIFIGRVIG